MVKKLTLKVKLKCLPTINPNFRSRLCFAQREPLLPVWYVFFEDICQAFTRTYVTTVNLQHARVQPCPGARFCAQTEHKTETVTLRPVSEGLYKLMFWVPTKQELGSNILFLRIYKIKLHCCFRWLKRLDSSIYLTFDHLFSKYTNMWIYIQLVCP